MLDLAQTRCALRGLGLALAASGAAPGCTAVHWSGSGGVDRHAGLVWIEQRQLTGGQRVRVSSFGIVLDLRAESRSITLGAQRTTTTAPTFVEVDDWHGFEAATVMAQAGTLTGTPTSASTGAPPRRKGSERDTSLLYGATARAPLARRTSTTLGARLGVGREDARAALGYASQTRFSLPAGGLPLAWVSSAQPDAHYLIHFKATPLTPRP